MKALKASICFAVTALALSLAPGAPSWAAEDEAGILTLQMKELYRVGKYAEALPLAQKSLALREKEFGPDDATVAMPLNDLGTIHYNLGQYAVVEQLYKRSLAIREKTSGSDQAEVAMALNNLGDLYRAEERFAEAEPILKRSLAIREKIAGPDDPSIVMPLSNLAALYSNMGRYDQSRPLFERGLVILDKANGPDDPEATVLMSNLADAYINLHRYADAERLLKRAIVVTAKAYRTRSSRHRAGAEQSGRALRASGPQRRGRAVLQAVGGHLREDARSEPSGSRRCAGQPCRLSTRIKAATPMPNKCSGGRRPFAARQHRSELRSESIETERRA